MRFRVGIDIGGTFTDVVAVDQEGCLHVGKVSSTPPDYSLGVIRALKSLDIASSDMDYFSHGSTVATNTVLQRRGARTGLITTRGFEDVLEIARADREELFNYWWVPPPPLVHRRDRVGIDERTSYEGTVLREVNEDSLRAAVEYLRRRGIESLAICLINSYANPNNERHVARCISELWPGIYTSISTEILPEMLEFERTSTTVVNAYLGPVMDHYLANLEQRLRERGYEGDVLIMGSAGGLMTAATARSRPAASFLSGLAAGAIAGSALAHSSAIPNLITLDVGGTSSDVALIFEGHLRYSTEHYVQFNVPVRLPAVDVHTIGAGGGSIAWIDRGGSLRVGPRSAGAIPGPVCYARGGTEPTVTDAALVLGWIDGQLWEQLYGSKLNAGAAAETLRRVIGEPFRMNDLDSASAVLRVAIGNLHQAIRAVTVQRGHDPREFRLAAYGGAGPMLAAYLARELSIPEVIVPIAPGVTSALGLLLSDVRLDFQRSILKREDEINAGELDNIFGDLIETASQHLQREGFTADRTLVIRQVDIQYFGQAKYLTIPVPEGPFTQDSLRGVVQAFLLAHEREYGYTMPPEVSRIEIANVRVTGRGLQPAARSAQLEAGTPETCSRVGGTRDVYFLGEADPVPASVFWRAAVDSGSLIRGPAVIEQKDTTIVVPPGTSARVDKQKNLILTTA
jgi:N-methylhydantoinase A